MGSSVYMRDWKMLWNSYPMIYWFSAFSDLLSEFIGTSAFILQMALFAPQINPFHKAQKFACGQT